MIDSESSDKMNKDKSTKVIALIALIIAVVSISVAFATITTNLQINGTANMSPAFKVNFADLSNANIIGDASIYNDPTLKATSISNVKVIFTATNESVTYNFNLKNGGILPARITSYLKTTPVCTGNSNDPTTATNDANLVCNNITYGLTYTDTGNEVTVGDLLPNSISKNLTFTIKYNGIVMPSEQVNVDNINLTLLFES